MQRIIPLGAIALSICMVLYGLSIVGSPAHTRKVQQDIATLRALSDLHCTIQTYYNIHQEMPYKLSDAIALSMQPITPYKPGCLQCYYSRNNPAWDLPQLSYEAKGTSYEVCVTLLTSKEDIVKQAGPDFQLMHVISQPVFIKSGKNCFTLKVSPCQDRKATT